MIAKDCAAPLGKCLESLRATFLKPCDELFVLITGESDGGETARVATLHGANVVKRTDLSVDFLPYVEKWIPEYKEQFLASGLKNGCIIDFAQARQIAADAAKHPVQFWVDSDDIFVDRVPFRFRAVVDRVFSDPQSPRDAIFMNYHYSQDDDGTVTSVLKRERVCDMRTYHWVGRCHETCIPREWNKAKGAAWFQDLDTHLLHQRDHRTDRTSDIRNYVILRKHYEEGKAGLCYDDPRTVFYLGNAARGLSRNGESVDYYKELIDRSGNPEDRFAAAYYIGLIYASEVVRRPLAAIPWFQKCMSIKPDDPRGPFGVSRAYYQLGKYKECIHWWKVGKLLPEPTQTLHTYNPVHIHGIPYQFAACAFKELGMRKELEEVLDHLCAHYPNNTDAQTVVKGCANWIAGQDLAESVKRMVTNSQPKSAEEGVKIARSLVSTLPAVPDELENHGITHLEKPDTRTGKDLVIWCGKAVEDWGPLSGKTGIGGSEKAVIQMAPRMQKRGYRVTVYANVPREQRGIDKETGVLWQHFGALNRDTPRGTVIFWRSPQALELPIAAEKRIVWCHDVQNPALWTPVRIALADQVWVQSVFHAGTLGARQVDLGDKLIVTRNGIDADLYRKYFGKVERDPKRVVYASSPDRGVLSAIELFQKANVPGSTLHLYYGFNRLFLKLAAEHEYRGIPDLGRDASMYDYMETVFKACDEDERIVMHGRIGWEKMAEEMCKAGVWLYPCKFEEISCMVAMEAQAAGCIPVASRYAALAETVFCGGNATVPDLTKALTDYPEFNRQTVHEEACKRFDYEALADNWVKLLEG